MTTSLSKIFPRIDKICDATFIRKVIGTTKKDAVIFITDNDDCRRFFEEKEIEIDRHNEIVRNDISEFFRATSMQMEVAKFKAVVKEKVAKEKSQKKELEKQAIIEEFLRQQERAKKDAAEREKLGLPPKQDYNAKTSSVVPVANTTAKTEANAASVSMVEAAETTVKTSQPLTTGQEDDKVQEEQCDSNSSDSSEETQMNLEDFYTMLKAVSDQGHIMFKSGNVTLSNVQIKLDTNLQKIVIQTKPTPTIAIKKTMA